MNSAPGNILVIKLGALGDIILATEAFHAIRAKHPNDRITLLTRKPFIAFTKMMPWFDDVMEDPNPKFLQLGRWLSLRKDLRLCEFSRVYDLQSNDRSSFYFRLVGPDRPEWCGPAKGCSHQRHDHRKDPVPAAERLLRFLESVDVPRAGPPELGWLTGPVDAFDLPANFVVIVPSCAPQHPHKRWPAIHFAKLAEVLAARGIATLAVGTALDREAIDAIQSLVPSVISLAGKTDIGQLAEVARRSIGVIGNDTGPIHIAAIVGAPTLVVMSGKSDPVRMTPHGPDVGCLQRENLDDLSVDDVVSSLRLRPGSTH